MQQAGTGKKRIIKSGQRLRPKIGKGRKRKVRLAVESREEPKEGSGCPREEGKTAKSHEQDQ
jgi:hypothetical protein